MQFKSGDIVKGLCPNELSRIISVQDYGEGSFTEIEYITQKSKKSQSLLLDPGQLEQLELVKSHDDQGFNGQPEHFKLYCEAERIQSAFQFDPLFAVNCSIVDPLPHQVEAVYHHLLPLPQIRFLLADDTGAGKTIMTGLLLKELFLRGHLERVLIITPGGLTKQWQEDEMQLKFNLDFKLLNRAVFGTSNQCFEEYKLAVTSIDFISQEDVLQQAQKSHWDFIVFDEAHKLSAYDYGGKIHRSRRYETAKALSAQCENLLLLTATPHRGRKDTFKHLLELLDEDIFASEELTKDRVKHLEKDGGNKFFIRRLKEQMTDWEGRPLFKQRFTQTASYALTPEEKELYDAVTQYLTVKKQEATTHRNTHVALALTVMQRRLTSSIAAIHRTLEKRWQTLQSILQLTQQQPELWKMRTKVGDLGDLNVDDLDELDELDDRGREEWFNLLSDPKKFKLFTTATDARELKQETHQVRELFLMADRLRKSYQEEQKLIKLKELLHNSQIRPQEKFVLFTEHKDTLDYLEDYLKTKMGFAKIATIHGSKNLDERRAAQNTFREEDCRVLLATDAAGEGINLQFCRILINWDIPWNPNRLEQRMGRIHRYGQKEDILVFNLVATNTREGKVLDRLLKKLDVIREQIGDDRVYDVIQDVLSDVSLPEIMQSVFDGQPTRFDSIIEEDPQSTRQRFQEKIQAHEAKFTTTHIRFEEARKRRDQSNEQRLQPYYIKSFFQQSIQALGGDWQKQQQHPSIFQITRLPQNHLFHQKHERKRMEALLQNHYTFDKRLFLDLRESGTGPVNLYYLNPGNPLFDKLVEAVKDEFLPDMQHGAILVDPNGRSPFQGFLVRSVIKDARMRHGQPPITDMQLQLVIQSDGDFHTITPVRVIDWVPPSEYALQPEPPLPLDENTCKRWAIQHISMPQLQATKDRVEQDAQRRQEYIQMGFTERISQINVEISKLQAQMVQGSKAEVDKLNEQYQSFTERIDLLKCRREERLDELEQMQKLQPSPPELLGKFFVMPLSQQKFKQHYGMSRDDEVESIAMQSAMQYEVQQGRHPEDVSAQNLGFDVRSRDELHRLRYIEVKGRSADQGDVMLSENEMNILLNLGQQAWLYIVTHCQSQPQLHCIQDPGNRLQAEKRAKGVQYLVRKTDWQKQVSD